MREKSKNASNDSHTSYRRTSSHPDLLSRSDLGEALDLSSRMLDKLD